MAQVRVRKRGKTFSYLFEAGELQDFMTACSDNSVALDVYQAYVCEKTLTLTRRK